MRCSGCGWPGQDLYVLCFVCGELVEDVYGVPDDIESPLLDHSTWTIPEDVLKTFVVVRDAEGPHRDPLACSDGTCRCNKLVKILKTIAEAQDLLAKPRLFITVPEGMDRAWELQLSRRCDGVVHIPSLLPSIED